MSSIAVVHPRFKLGGGVDRVIYEVSARLRMLYGFDITIFTTDARFNNYSGIKVQLLKNLAESSYFLQLQYTLMYMHLKPQMFEKYDLLWLHSIPLSVPALHIKNLCKIPVLFTFHGVRTIKDANLLIHRTSARIAFRKLDAIVTVSDYTKWEAEQYGVKPVRIYNGCDLNKFHPTWEDENYMLYLGELTKHKCTWIPIAVSSILKIPLIIIGDGVERKRLERYAEKINAPVKFYGLVDEHTLVRAIQKCSFMISGSIHEAFGLAFLEAEACGKPVIARRCTAIPEVVKHKETGFLCEDISDYIKYAEKLWKDKELRKRMGLNARKHAEKFSWDVATKKYGELIKALL